ncbi:MAG: sodium-dependent transporter [Bdellovibrionia bacterium]
MVKRGTWQSRLGFYFVAIGSAVGLGNLWRFPYVVGENGGGAFILMYVFLAIAVGAPILIAELILGKTTGKSVIVATRESAEKFDKRYRWFGRLSVLLSLVVLSYYSVISGWVLHFITQFVVDIVKLAEFDAQVSGIEFLMKNGWLQWMLASAHLLLTLVVVVKGIHDGLEKWISFIMPFFLILVGVLLFESFSQPSMPDVLRFLFYPDFSKLTLSSLAHALGHVFFTLSVGFGTMVTFGSYLKDQDHVPTTGFRVAIVDTLASLVAAVLIFPVVFQASNIPLTDPAMMFEALPQFLKSIQGGTIFGVLFFVCLYLAALNASIGLLEVVVSNLKDLYKQLSRAQATWIAGAIALVLATLPALSNSLFNQIRPFGKSLIEVLDSFLINWLLPIIVVGIAQIYLRSRSDKDLQNQFVTSEKFISQTMFPHWKLALKYIVPTAVLLGLFLQIIDLIKTNF